METNTNHRPRLSRARRALVALAAMCGAVAVVPLATAGTASATMSSCVVVDLNDAPPGAYSYCNSGDSNDRQRANVSCLNVGMRYGPIKAVGYASVVRCPSGSTRVSHGVQVCETWYQSPTLSYCASGWYQREHSHG